MLPRRGSTYTSRQTEEQTRDAYQGVISQIAQVQALKQAVESDRIALQATEAGYQVGTKTVVDVLTTRAAAACRPTPTMPRPSTAI